MLNQMFNEKRSKNGFTIVELVVVMTIMGILASSAVIAYNKVVNDAKATKSRDVVSALQQAKALFMLDPGTTAQDVSDFNADPDSNFDKIAPYLEVNGVQPPNIAAVLKSLGVPQTTTVSLGTVDDHRFSPVTPHAGATASVNGCGPS
jgi:prepilin-type N-terminal cleavage/methylation domain-containing protein